jgi:hypothetical protein
MHDSAKNVAGRLRACAGSEATAREALAILMEAAAATSGHLFCLVKGRLQLVASSDASKQDVRELQNALESMLLKEYSSDMVTTALETTSLPPQSQLRGGAKPLVLLGKHDGDTVVVGVAALQVPGDGRFAVRRATLEGVIQALISTKLADPLVCAT